MKTAILINGVYRPQCVKIHVVLNELLEAFPDIDLYLHTWDEYKYLVPDYLNVESCPEPIIHYNAMLDPDPPSNIKYKSWRQQFIDYDAGYRKDDGSGKIQVSDDHRKKLQKHFSSTKQILGYADLYEKVQKLNKGYDRFIRTRWDICVQEGVDFNHFLKLCTTGPIGFGAPTNRSYPHFFKKLHQIRENQKEEIISDQLIIHHKNHFDPQLVYRLHKDKQLLPSEFGWHQVLVKPYDVKSRSYENGAGLYRNYKEKRKNNEHR
jgi:hypothetical protein